MHENVGIQRYLLCGFERRITRIEFIRITFFNQPKKLKNVKKMAQTNKKISNRYLRAVYAVNEDLKSNGTILLTEGAFLQMIKCKLSYIE